ncbi:MAG TPA: GNAT family N-acetyltransferase [Methanotrichaceae archaeon]|nr:GNAT family N-acetyltransferase [Methanotrichaceae archaeon]
MLFETPRLLVRPLLDSDYLALHKIYSKPAVMCYIGNLKPYSPEQTQKALTDAHDSYRLHGFGPWAIIYKKRGHLIGVGGLEVLPCRELPELSYIFAPDCWGHGLATEFAKAAIDYSFQKLGLSKIGASFDPENKASMRVAEKVGMRYIKEGLDEYSLPTIFYALCEHNPGQTDDDSLKADLAANEIITFGQKTRHPS